MSFHTPTGYGLGFKGVYSPWGEPDDITEIIPGVHIFTTPSHGGWHLSPWRNGLIPLAFKLHGSFAEQRREGWYEEDCDWGIPCHFFAAELRRAGKIIYAELDCARIALRIYHKEAVAEAGVHVPHHGNTGERIDT